MISISAGELRAQQKGLIDAGWDDPFFRAFLEQSGQDAAPGQDTLPFVFSLPVLGFRFGVINGGEAALGALGTQLATAVAGWPACADPDPTVTTVPQTIEQAAGTAPGSWFTSTYDFGCLQVVIEGDRNPPDARVVPEVESAPESGTIQVSREDENAGEAVDADGRVLPDAFGELSAKGPPVASYTRGNITYTVSLFCTPESQSFCVEDAKLIDLVRQLIPVAGHP